MTRRTLLASGALPAVAAEEAPSPKRVFFVGDGLSLTPLEQARLLAQLAEQGKCETDSYSLGGAVTSLETKFAAMLGKEAAVFLPTGTLANHLAVRVLAGERRRVLAQGDSHLYCDSGDSAQTLSQLNVIPLATGRAAFGLEDVKREVERGTNGRVLTPVGAISIETPVRRHFGEVMPMEEMRLVSAYAREKGIGLHLDGSRIFLVSSFTGVSVKEYAGLFDTVYVSLWKYFNSTAGAVLAGPKKMIENLFHMRRMFGGGIPHAWPMAAVATHFAEGFEGRYAKAAEAAKELVSGLGETGKFEALKPANASHILWVRLKGGDGVGFRKKLMAAGVEIGGPVKERGGAIGLNVNESILRRPVRELVDLFARAV